MKLLDKNNYYKLTEPLKKVAINNLFARSVIEQCIDGKAYVDNYDNPQTYYVVHPYGMSLLFGNWQNHEFNELFKDYAINTFHKRDKYEWMQAYPDNWDSVLNNLFKDYIIKSSNNIESKETGVIEINTRVNFKFNTEKYLNFREKLDFSNLHIVRTDKVIFNEMKGSVVPLYFWNDSESFLKNGIGFSLFYQKKLASTVYSSFIHDKKLEFGIETIEEFRGKGLAQYTCSVLIDYCIENNYEPIWACRLENSSSYRLAQKLGFDPVIEIPYYRLSK